ncbi:hypothetical protein L227DRAFT_533730 [Lentinus tigrinus ALCF2SS1-6]|uniref:Uncharacterized protein n=1 Tax=Lentinus tigrinus ALCF2SS1-6 TaxID=1328759 RepID=A0A5C2RV29_9APHY|nr:hypothetical protein L227DRAFT_533730 [Lentinus tigrinus ALCF2SS1-6]
MQPFLKNQVESTRLDGYWLEAFPFHVDDTCGQNLVGHGLGTSTEVSKIEMFINPRRDGDKSTTVGHKDWPKTVITELWFPVAFSYADITGNKYNDVILTDGNGPSLHDIWPDGRGVHWYENTGDPTKSNWTGRFIGRSPGMHRIRTGHFTTKDKVQVFAAPIVVKSDDFTTPAPMIVWTAPDDPKAPDQDEGKGWDESVAFPDTFRLVHEITVVPGANNGLDQVLLAGREGVSLLWYDVKVGKWTYQNIGTGLPQQPGNPFWGSGSVDVARVHGDSAGYVASCEAFHGNHVSVYVKDKDAPCNQLQDVKWTRHVLEDFGPLNEAHTGSIHYVTCADIDDDGVEETLVALMGSDPPSWKRTGVWCYKPVDLHAGKFTKFKLSDNSAARIAVADLLCRGGKKLDFATISYSVPGYFESPNPAVNAYVSSSITAEKLDAEVVFRVPRPTNTHLADEVSFLDVAGRKMSLAVVPPHSKYALDAGAGVKIIAGRLTWKDQEGKHVERTMAADPFSQVSVLVNSRDVHTGAEGALFVIFHKSDTSGTPPYSDMKQLVAHNIFPSYFPQEVRQLDFPWVKVEDRPWANGRFKGVEFYNLVGFHVRYNDDTDEHVCHIQGWTAGVGVSAGFHNHTDQSFCELHTCLVNGTGQGGMAWATVPDDQFDPAHPDKEKYRKLVVPEMAEHGPLWRTDKDGLALLRKNDTIDYPWHAWLAGDGDPADQRFDVWFVFELPPLIARAKVVNEAHNLAPGTYRIRHASSNYTLSVEGGDSTDNTPLLVDDEHQKWTISVLTGTEFRILTNTISGSSATVAWPPEDGQEVVGSRTPARLDLTSSWALKAVQDNVFEVRLIDTDLVLSVADDKGKRRVVVKKASGSEDQRWVFEI